MARVCVDSCFLIGLYDRSDQHHQSSARHFAALFGYASNQHILIAPWPILYECCSTRQSTDRRKTDLLHRDLSYLRASGRLTLLDDRPFRESSLQEHFEVGRPLSLVDRVLRAMIAEKPRAFDFFLTYNTGDFADMCQQSGTPLIDEAILADSYGL